MRSSPPAGGLACSCSSRTSQSNDIICKNPGIVSHSSSALSSASFRLATSLTSRSPSMSLSAAVGAALTSSPSPRPPAAVQDCASSCGAAAGGAAGCNAVLGCASHMPSSSSRSPSFFTATHTGRMKEAAAASSTRIFPAVRMPFSRCTDTSWRSFSSSSFSSAEVQDEDRFFGKHAQQRSAGSRSASRCWLQPALRRQHQRLFSAVTLLLTAVLLLLWQEEAAGFQAMVELPGGGKQCVGEQLSKHVLVVGEVHLLHPVPSASATGRKATTPLLVTALDSSSQLPIYKQQGKEHVRTAFTTTRAGTHSFCVQNTGAERMVVDIQMLWGPEARDYGQIAKAEHLDEVMLQLMRLQDRLKLYQANVLYMRQNEQKMREDSDATASWLMSFCIINVLLLILTALASAYYFKRFFRSKKII